MKKSNFIFRFFILFFIFLSLFGTIFAAKYNTQGSFIISIENQKSVVYNDNIETTFTFNIKNTLNQPQTIQINAPKVSGFDSIIKPAKSFVLAPNEEKKISYTLKANSNFDYSPNVVSPDTIVISQKEDYEGQFDFPLTIESISKNESVGIKFEVRIVKREKKPISFEIKIASNEISPILPIAYSIQAQNLETKINPKVYVYLGNKVLDEQVLEFTKSKDYIIKSLNIDNSFNPGEYELKIIVRVEQENNNEIREWYAKKKVRVLPFENLDIKENYKDGFLIKSALFKVINKGNIPTYFIQKINLSFFDSFFLSYKQVDGLEVLKNNNEVEFKLLLKKGESKELNYSFNYIPLYIIIIVLFIIFAYIYIRKNSNPLDIETKIYDIVKVKHEGVKSLKLRIGFENIKAEKIDEIKIIFRMPAYLSIKDGSFLLVDPNHVLKGKNQYKLIWSFKGFELGDSRILGFTLINSKGILGDIRIPDLEVEIKINGKVRKYYKSFPIIRG